jgi:hypothetical protein
MTDKIKTMKIFQEEKLDEFLLQRREELKRQLDPIIDQIVLARMRQEILPREQYQNKERQKEFKDLMNFYINLSHQLIGYNPQE